MPWHLVERDGQVCVVKDGEDAPIPGGCHPTQEEAQAHMRALYAAEPAAQGGAADSPPCGCGSREFLGGDLGHPRFPPRTAASTEPFDAAFPVPAYPPRDWFYERPDWLTPETKIGVDDEGRVAGYFYTAGQCLLYRPDACPKPSPTYYAAFHQSEVVCADGAGAVVGVIGNTHGHADPYARVDAAQRHYQDPSAQLVACRAYDDEHGGFILGSVVPHATYGDVALLRRSALSGDWRHMPKEWWSAHGVQASVVNLCEGFDCIGPTLVTRPGLPIVREFTSQQRAAAILGGVGGVQLPDQETIMGETKVELGDGVVVTKTSPVEFAPPGPHPARTAADAPGAPPAAPVESPEEESTEAADVEALKQIAADHEARIAAIEEALTQMVDSQMAALEASAVPLPA